MASFVTGCRRETRDILQDLILTCSMLSFLVSQSVNTRQVVANAPKVKVDFYMEALCPGCQYFTTHVLAPVLKERGIDHLVHLNVVPAGNAELKLDEKTGSMKMVCQHGEEECEVDCLFSDYHLHVDARIYLFVCRQERRG